MTTVARFVRPLLIYEVQPCYKGARGKAAADLDQLVAVIESFIQMCMSLESEIKEVEINPLLVSGKSIAAVDFLIIP